MMLKICAIGIPLVIGLVVWRWGDRFSRGQRWLTATILGLVGLLALTSFLITDQVTCTFSLGRQNCLFDGLASLSLLVLSVVLLRSCVIASKTRQGIDYALMLLLISAWAGVGLSNNLLGVLVFLNLLAFVLSRMIKRRGLSGGFLVLRDDYQDDYGPKKD